MASFLLFGSRGICLTPSFRIDKSHNRMLLINTLMCLQDASMISSPAPTNRLVIAGTGRQQIVRGIVKNACIVKFLIHKFIVDPKSFLYISNFNL